MIRKMAPLNFGQRIVTRAMAGGRAEVVKE